MLAMVINFMTSTVRLKIIEMREKDGGKGTIRKESKRERERKRTNIANKM